MYYESQSGQLWSGVHRNQGKDLGTPLFYHILLSTQRAPPGKWKAFDLLAYHEEETSFHARLLEPCGSVESMGTMICTVI